MKKLFSVLLTLALLVGMVPTMALAAEIDCNKADYQSVLNKLNAQYGTKTRFATSEELQKIGLKPQKIDISPAEFEKEVLKAVESSRTASRKARAASQKLQRAQVGKSGSGICKPGKAVTPMASYNYSHSKPVTGADVHLSAIVNNSGNFWKFEEISSVWTTADQSIPYPWFSANTYNYQLIDTRRTCAIDLNGYTIDRYGVIVDPNASRYVEFWAGTNM